MIIKYKPQYKKAILDITEKNGDSSAMVEQNLKHKDGITFVYLDNDRKFKGFICGAELSDTGATMIYLSTKDKKIGPGISLLKYFKKYCKEKGFSRVCYIQERSNKIHLEVL